MKRTARRFLTVVVCAVAVAPADAHASRPAVLPLVYLACAAAPGDPTRIVVRDTPKGPVVEYDRAGSPRQVTSDANLAFLSRRLFFQIKMGDMLVEFQGRAGDESLDGLLSDENGPRHIALRAAAPGSNGPDCGKHP